MFIFADAELRNVVFSVFNFVSFRCSNQTEAADSPVWAYNYCPTSHSWIVLLGLILYLAFFAPGIYGSLNVDKGDACLYRSLNRAKKSSAKCLN